MKKILYFIIIFLIHYFCFADYLSVSVNLDTGSVFPVKNEAIRLVEEYITYDHVCGEYSDDKSDKFNCKFILKNTTNKKYTINVGFPIANDIDGFLDCRIDTMSGESYPAGTDPKKVINEYFNYECYLNGNKINHTLVNATSETIKNLGYKYFYLSEIVFSEKEEVELTCKYSASPFERIYDGGHKFAKRMTYILESGSYWKDTIKYAKINFNITEGSYPEYGDEMGLKAYKKLARNTIESWTFGSAQELYLGNDAIKHAQSFNDNFLKIFEIRCFPYNCKFTREGKKLQLEWIFDDIEPDFDIICQWIVNTCENLKLSNFPIASSSYPDNIWGIYSPKRAFDNNIETAWVEGVAGHGIGEQILFIIPGNAKEIKIFPGYGKENVFYVNNRVKTATLYIFYIDHPEKSEFLPHYKQITLEFKDIMAMQEFDLDLNYNDSKVFEKYLGVLTISQVYKGRDADTSIAEIQFE